MSTTCFNTIARINYEDSQIKNADIFERAEEEFNGSEEKKIHDWCVLHAGFYAKLQGDREALEAAHEWLDAYFNSLFGERDYYYEIECYYQKIGQTAKERAHEIEYQIINKIAERM